jgi:hypothetical protein
MDFAIGGLTIAARSAMTAMLPTPTPAGDLTA